ncbi:MAG: glycosyltransferase family 4 protein [Flavobacteriales bacterium]|jgi:glycosyltransferase involved in cell wall biosynthesis|nr:glycosyltransferase family 4 protein [Flavobacteriales bacterium]
MKKILYIGNQPKHNKATVTSVDTLGGFLAKEGYSVRTASSKRNKGLRLLDMCFSVIKFRKETDIVLIDTYSTYNFYYAVAVGRLCRKYKIPYIPLLHGGNLPNRLQKSKQMSEKLFKNAFVNITPSNYLLEEFKLAGFSNLFLIPNSLDIKNYNYLQRKMAPKLLWVRSFSEIYNPMLAIRVMENFQKIYPEASLAMVGPDKDGTLQKCKEVAQAKKLNVTFTGKLSKKEWIELSADYAIFINTTNFDNTPVSVIEAMALGLPVVSTNVGGIPYLLKDRKEALLVNPRNPEMMVQAIVELIDDTTLANELSHNARAKAETFDWDKVKFLWDSVFK